MVTAGAQGSPRLSQQGLHEGQRAGHALLSIPTAPGSAAPSPRPAATQGSRLNSGRNGKEGKGLPYQFQCIWAEINFYFHGSNKQSGHVPQTSRNAHTRVGIQLLRGQTLSPPSLTVNMYFQMLFEEPAAPTTSQ